MKEILLKKMAIYSTEHASVYELDRFGQTGQINATLSGVNNIIRIGRWSGLTNHSREF